MNDRPLVISKAVGKGTAYVYLAQWIADGGAALRPILAYAGEQAAPLKIAPADEFALHEAEGIDGKAFDEVAMTLFGKTPEHHRLFADHACPPKPAAKAGRGRRKLRRHRRLRPEGPRMAAQAVQA